MKTCFQEKVFSETRLYLGIFEKVCPIRSDEGCSLCFNCNFIIDGKNLADTVLIFNFVFLPKGDFSMIAVGADHAGVFLKNDIVKLLEKEGYEVKDFGTYSDESCDYPIYAKAVADAVASGLCEKGILVCGTGIGMSMAANKVKGIRAAVCSEAKSAEMTRRHNDANILCLGGRVIGPGVAGEMVDLFLDTEYEGGRHANRVAKISAIEEGKL